ncbi:starch-binding protein [Aquimarina sp. W85]|uniref:starch-binding protein n=1 Tax=Aquimarina rhodophyticola TaxID=3342246 RepID=UPI00366CCFD8
MNLKITQYVIIAMTTLFVFLGNAQDEDVLFQAFDWNVQNQPAGQTWYDVVTQNRNTIKNAGIDIIWMPPPSDAASPQGYLPRELYNLNSSYGTQDQLKNLINQYHNLGLKVLSDIVINHRVGSPDAVTFVNPSWPTYFITSEDEGRNFVNYPVNFSNNTDYFPGTSLKIDGSNGSYAAARDLDHKNPEVRNELINWMNFLKNDIGFDGWRYDFVHGYDPIYNKQYNDATNPYFAVGELLESSRVQTNNWVNYTQQSSSAFDFNTKVTLQNALRDNNLSYLKDGNGKPSGMIGVNPSKSVTFLENHDTGPAQQCCGEGYIFPGGEVNLRKGYAYILTHPGNPMVFWTHFFDTGAGVQNAIKDLITIRKSVRIHAGSTISIAEARNDLYAAYIDGKSGTLAMKLGAGSWTPNGNDWTLRTSGNGYAVWSKGANTPTTSVPPFKVYHKKPASWNETMNVYLYNASTNSKLTGTADWPGQPMNSITGTLWYDFTINPSNDVKASDIRLIFNDGNNQTIDLSKAVTGWYTNNTWSDTCPSDCPDSDSSTNEIIYNFYTPNGWGTNTNIYIYNASTNTTMSGTQDWPGQAMSSINGSQWNQFKFTVPNGVSTSDIRVLFTNGNGDQTVDLSRSSSGWFTVTNTVNGKRTGEWSTDCPTNCPSQNFILETNATLEKTKIATTNIKIAPNPIDNTSQFIVTTSQKGNLQITIYTSTGKPISIINEPITAGYQTFEVTTDKLLKKGLYFCTIVLDGKTIDNIKLIKK